MSASKASERPDHHALVKTAKGEISTLSRNLGKTKKPLPKSEIASPFGPTSWVAQAGTGSWLVARVFQDPALVRFIGLASTQGCILSNGPSMPSTPDNKAPSPPLQSQSDAAHPKPRMHKRPLSFFFFFFCFAFLHRRNFPVRSV